MRQAILKKISIDWRCRQTWRETIKNTSWCLLGCAVGDYSTILYFQFYSPSTNAMLVMGLAIINGLLTSICLETFILSRKFSLKESFKLAINMSFISMIAMECAMNLTDYAIEGKAKITLISLFPSLIAGFLTPLPYNYWRIKYLGKSCH